MRAALMGDDAAYKTLLKSLAIFLRAEVRKGFARYGYGVSDTEDVVQDVLLALHLKRATWRSSDPIIPWVRAIARNKLIDHLRKGGRRINVPIDDVVDTLPAEPPAEHLSERDASEVLARLNGRQREIVEQISINGASIRETAAKFAISEGAVRVALHRGLTALAKAFRTEEP